MGKFHNVLPGNEIPKWFKFQSVGSFITLEMPADFFNNSRVQGIAFSAILAFSDRHVDCGRWFSFSFELKVKNTKDCSPHNTQIFQSRVNFSYIWGTICSVKRILMVFGNAIAFLRQSTLMFFHLWSASAAG